MNTKVIFYKQDMLDQKTKFKLRRELLGLEQKSNFSQYKYAVKGILNNIPHYRPVNSTIIVKNEHVAEIKKILKKYKTTIEIFDINIPSTKLDTQPTHKT